MGELWERRWLRRHALLAPFGVFAATLLLTLGLEQWQWQAQVSWRLAGSLVDLGAVLYAMVAVLAEKGVDCMFWALEKRRERREKLEAAARAVGLAEGRSEGLAEGRSEGRAMGRDEGYAEAKREFDAQLERVVQAARERGVAIDDLLSQ